MSTTTSARSPRHSPQHTAFGRAVRFARAMRGLSQEELGHRAGLHRNYVGAIERGEINPTFRVLLKLERGLRLPLSELVILYEDVLSARSDSTTTLKPTGVWLTRPGAYAAACRRTGPDTAGGPRAPKAPSPRNGGKRRRVSAREFCL